MPTFIKSLNIEILLLDLGIHNDILKMKWISYRLSGNNYRAAKLYNYYLTVSYQIWHW